MDEKIKVVHQKALEAEASEWWDDALKYTRMGLQWVTDPERRSKLGFLEGRVVFKAGEKQQGLIRMRGALEYADSENVSLDDEKLYWGECLLSHGKKGEVREALGKILEGFSGAGNINQSLVEEFCKISVGQEYYTLLADLMAKIRESIHAYWISVAIKKHLNDSQITFRLGESLVKVLELASKANTASRGERQHFSSMADQIQQQFAKIQGYPLKSGHPMGSTD